MCSSDLAGNHPSKRMDRLHEFWDRMEFYKDNPFASYMAMMGAGVSTANTIMRGIPGFFKPNTAALFGSKVNLGIEHAAYYSTEPLHETLNHLVDMDYLQTGATRLTVGAVNANTGAMRYFDSREDKLTVDHIRASGALPPAFPAVRIDGEPYWDGGIYSDRKSVV